MSQHTHCAHSILQGGTMGTYINPISQSAHNDGVWIIPLEVGNEVSAYFTTIGRAFACAYNADDVRTVQVGCSTLIQHQGSVFTLLQTLGIIFIIQRKHTQMFLLNKLHLFLRHPKSIIHMMKSIPEPLACVRKNIQDFVPVEKHFCGRTHRVEQGSGIQQIQPFQFGEGDGIDDFLCVQACRNGANFWLSSGLSASFPSTRQTESTCARMHSFISGKRKMSCMKM